MSVLFCLVYKSCSWDTWSWNASLSEESVRELLGSRAVLTQQLRLPIEFVHPQLVSTLLGQPMGAYLDMLGRERERESEDLGSYCTLGAHKLLQPLSP